MSKLTKNKKLALEKIEDGRAYTLSLIHIFSGIATYRGEVNGRWCLFSYDPRYNLMRCSLKEPVFVSGQVNEVKVIVEDRVCLLYTSWDWQ